jgi:hypothetical protein
MPLVTTKRFASGKYFVYIDDQRIPAVVIGGNGRFNVEYRNDFRGHFKTVKLAAQYAADYHNSLTKEPTQ